MNNLQSAMWNYMDWLMDPVVRGLEPATRDAYCELIWRAVAAWDSGFVLGPRGKRATLAQSIVIAGTSKERVQTLVDLGLVEVVEGGVFVQRGLDLLNDQDCRRRHSSNAGKGNKKQPTKDRPESTRVNPSQPESTGVDPSQLGQDRTGQDRTEQDPTLSSVLESESSPARTHEEAEQRESDADFWGPKIEAVYQAIHGSKPQAGSREAIAAALRTTRASDCVLAIEGARRNPWAMQQANRRALPGILSPKRIDGHIQDARSFYGWTNGEGETWAETMMRSHGGGK